MKRKRNKGAAIVWTVAAILFFSSGWIARSQFEMVKCNVIKTIVESL